MEAKESRNFGVMLNNTSFEFFYNSFYPEKD